MICSTCRRGMFDIERERGPFMLKLSFFPSASLTSTRSRLSWRQATIVSRGQKQVFGVEQSMFVRSLKHPNFLPRSWQGFSVAMCREPERQNLHGVRASFRCVTGLCAESVCSVFVSTPRKMFLVHTQQYRTPTFVIRNRECDPGWISYV